MRKHLKWFVFASAYLGMGIAMPSCPGQQAMQQQIDTLQTSNMELTHKVQSLNTQVTSIHTEMKQVKELLPQMTNVIQAQKGALDQLELSVKEIRSKTMKAAGKRKGK